MKAKKLNLNNSNVYRSMLYLGVPAILTALFDEINGVIDTIFMGRFIGSEAVASMSIVIPFLIFSSALSMLFGDGAAISMSRYLGAENYKSSSKVASLTVKITLITSIALGVISFIFMPKLLIFFDLDNTTMIYTVKYIRYFSLGLPIFMYSMLMLKILYAEGYSRITLRLTIVQVVTNVLLNAILLGIFRLGVEGAVAGTLLSYLLQSYLVTRYLVKNSQYTKLRNEKFDVSYFKEVIPLGIPAFFTMILLAVTMGIQSKIIAAYGTSALGVQAITGNIFSISSSVSTGIMNAALVLMAYSAGAGNKHRFIEVIKKSIVLTIITSIMINIPLILAPEIIGSFFTDSLEILKLLVIPAFIIGITSPFIFTTNTVLFAMQPIGMERTSTVVFAVQQFGLFIPIIYLLKDISFNHAMAAQPAAEVMGGIITLLLIPKFITATREYFGKNKKSIQELNSTD